MKKQPVIELKAALDRVLCIPPNQSWMDDKYGGKDYTHNKHGAHRYSGIAPNQDQRAVKDLADKAAAYMALHFSPYDFRVHTHLTYPLKTNPHRTTPYWKVEVIVNRQLVWYTFDPTLPRRLR